VGISLIKKQRNKKNKNLMGMKRQRPFSRKQWNNREEVKEPGGENEFKTNNSPQKRPLRTN